MKSQNPALRTAIATAVLASAGMTSFSALAASSASMQRPDAAARAEIQQTYRAERAACLDGSSTQDRGACLAEAAAARQEALAGVLGVKTVAGTGRIEPTEPDLLANALARCDAVPSDVRSDCERRVTGGDGVIVTGSVAEGVIVRELAPVEAPTVLAQAETTAPAAEPATTVMAEPTEPVMEAEPASQAAAPAQDGVVGAGLSEGETLVPAEPAPATGLMAEPLAETQPAPALEAVPEAAMDAAPDTAAEAAAPTLDAPVAAEPAMTEPAAAEPAIIEPAAQVEKAPAAIEAGPASGADPVAYPEWMVPIRFE